MGLPPRHTQPRWTLAPQHQHLSSRGVAAVAHVLYSHCWLATALRVLGLL